jgi:Uma2 family endonuclease
MAQSTWIVDPADPRAPPQEVWDRLSSAERTRIVESLPTDMPLDLHPPEGDAHRKPKERARDALDEFFRSIGRRVYVSSELVTYYPGEPRFCPDILAVLDVEPHERSSWIVSQEGKGLDCVIEVHVAGSSEKDFEKNVVRYARLGIPEYFVFDRPRSRVLGFRLRSQAASYERIVPQAGRLHSQVLSLDLTVDAGMLRFYHGTAPLLFIDELVSKLNTTLSELVEARDTALRRAEEEARRAEEEARRAEEEARRAEEEAHRAQGLASENDALRAELERLRRNR